MIDLRHATADRWTRTVLADLESFLRDHAANERKASASAITLAVHYPDRPELVEAMIDLGREELRHFKQVHDILVARGQTLGLDSPDPYMSALRRLIRKPDMGEYLLDRLLVFAVVEARGAERFALLAGALEDEALKTFYRRLARAEGRHESLFLRLAKRYHPEDEVAERLALILAEEAAVMRRLPLRAVLHAGEASP